MQVNQDMAVRQYTQTMQAVSRRQKKLQQFRAPHRRKNTAGASAGKRQSRIQTKWNLAVTQM